MVLARPESEFSGGEKADQVPDHFPQSEEGRGAQSQFRQASRERQISSAPSFGRSRAQQEGVPPLSTRMGATQASRSVEAEAREGARNKKTEKTRPGAGNQGMAVGPIRSLRAENFVAE